MTVHEDVLRTARRICRERGDWEFTPEEIVRALPELNANSVRTHVVSRCCINAPKNHPHKWDYFRRVLRGVYEIAPPYRRDAKPKAAAHVAESAAAYHAAPLRDSVHAVISRGLRAFVVARDGVVPADLRDFAAARLPHYCLPDQWLAIDRLPLTANGKLDAQALASRLDERPPAAPADPLPWCWASASMEERWLSAPRLRLP